MPGATLQAHNHPYPRYVYVLSGNLQVNNIETGQTDTYKPGNFILESVGQILPLLPAPPRAQPTGRASGNFHVPLRISGRGRNIRTV
jgi:hypothetical protein